MNHCFTVREVALQVKIILNLPRDLPHRIPLLGFECRCLHGHDVGTLAVECGIAGQPLGTFDLSQGDVVRGQAVEDVSFWCGLRASVAVGERMGDLVAVIRTQQQAIVHQLAQRTVGSARLDV